MRLRKEYKKSLALGACEPMCKLAFPHPTMALRSSGVLVNIIPRLNVSRETALMAERDVFMSSFCKAYAEIPEAVLGLNPGGLSVFLSTQFDEDVTAYLNGDDNRNRFYSAVGPGTDAVTGYLSVDIEDENGGAAYMRQLAVLPDMQKKGVASALVCKALTDLSCISRVTVAYRKVNLGASKFYKRLGFVPDESCHSTLDPDLYEGLVWCPSEENISALRGSHSLK